jgi:hypothetical protein
MKKQISWVATYTDGSALSQFNADGSENRYPDIDRSRLATFAMYYGDMPLVRYHFDRPNLRLVYRKRVFMFPGEGAREFYLVGWQIKDKAITEGDNLQSISVIGQLPDGTPSIEVLSRWYDHPLFEAIEPIECEVNDNGVAPGCESSTQLHSNPRQLERTC